MLSAMLSNSVDEECWKTVGYWFNEKKSQKFGSDQLIKACRKKKINFVKINLDEDISAQGPFDLILHKFTPLFSASLFGDKEASKLVESIEEYLRKSTEVIVVDPIWSIKQLLLREETYRLLGSITQNEKRIFTPPYVTLRSADAIINTNLLKKSGVAFPVVCKPLDASGGPHAHQMALILNENKMADVPIPCVAESFIKHGAVLYKLFILGHKWFVCLRPSLKNFSAGEYASIFFNSHHVSKADSRSPLTHRDQLEDQQPKADLSVLQRIVAMVKEALACDFVGIDVVLDVESDRYAIIDINPFPSYDMVPNLMETIAEVLHNKLCAHPCTNAPVFVKTSNFDQTYFVTN